MNRIVLTRTELNSKKFVVYLEINKQGEIVNLKLIDDNNISLVNNIYNVKVDNILSNKNSAFVKIDSKTKGYLSLNNVKDCIYTHKYSKKSNLCCGDELLVQVTKDSVKTKDYTVSTKLTFYGKYSILTTDNQTISVSNKLSKSYSDELKKLLNAKYSFHIEDGYGLIIRTNAVNITLEDLYNDIDNLIQTYKSVKDKANHSSLYSCVYKSPTEYLLYLNSFNLGEIEQIITDQPDIYSELEHYLNSEYKKILSFYQDEMVKLSTLYSINSQLDKLLSKKVWLKSGANIIVEQLETLTVIDVNTSKNQSKKSNFLDVNIEAAKEIVKQIKLRNISGMIIIDFINMKNADDNEELIKQIKSIIKKEDNNCQFIDITKLGLIELTRKKTYKSLKEQINNNI